MTHADGRPPLLREERGRLRLDLDAQKGGCHTRRGVMMDLEEGVVMDPLRDVTEARRIRKVLGA